MAGQNAQQRRKNGTATPRTGQYRKGKTERWNGTKWVKVNVVHKGQKATLGGKPVTADGRGNWRTKGDSRGRNGQTAGRYAPGERVKTTPLKPIPASKRPKDMQAGTVYGDAGQPPAPKLPPKPTASKPSPTKKPTPKPVVKKPVEKRAPAYNKPSTTKGPTKSGGFIASKGSSTKGGPTADGNTYKNQIKSKRLRDALSSLKVRDYKKKK